MNIIFGASLWLHHNFWLLKVNRAPCHQFHILFPAQHDNDESTISELSKSIHVSVTQQRCTYFTKTDHTASLYILYLFVARSFLAYIALFVFRIVSIRISAKIRLEYLKALFRLPVSALDTFPNGQASNTLTTTANILQVGISDKLGLLVQATTLLIAAVVIAFKYSWALTLVTSSGLVLIFIIYGILIPMRMTRQKEVDLADEKASSIAGEVLGSVRMIVACGAERRIVEKFSGWVQESQKRGLRLSAVTGWEYAPSE